MKTIAIRGAREHNLKAIDLDLPKDKLIVVTGLSGSGKSSLAFDTIYAEGQRRYVESLSAYARQFLGQMSKPDVDSIDGLSPAISIDQKTTSKNPRSTVGTVTEIYDYLRLLFARIGTPYCPDHNVKIQSQSPGRIADQIQERFKGQVTVLSPVVRQMKGTYEKVFLDLNKEGYTKARVDKEIKRTDDKIVLERYKKHDIEAVIDRLETSDRKRLVESIENSLKKSSGLVIISDSKREELYSSKMACGVCGLTFEELQPRMFSFNSPFGACESCHGLGFRMDFDPDLIIPDKAKSIADGAIEVYKNLFDGWRASYVAAVAKHYGFSMMTPVKDLPKKAYDTLMYGSKDRISFNFSGQESSWTHTGFWEGLLPQTERLYKNTKSEYRRNDLERFMRISPCTVCNGRKLKKKVLAVRISSKNIIDVTDMAIKDSLVWFRNLVLSEKEKEIARQVLKEINARLGFLDRVGLNYISLSRSAGSLSGGEAQRIRLATQIGSNLTGVLYILDEPSIGLHQRDNAKLIKTLQDLRDLGNTVIVVEHDEDTIRSADYVVDVGPGAGVHGGEVVAKGTPQQIEASKKSLTGQYLTGSLKISYPEKRREPRGFITIKKAEENNLKKLDVRISTGVMTSITGVSGSGKSTLIYEILYKGLMKQLHDSRESPGKHAGIDTNGQIDKVVIIDQSPIGRTPRSNPATYTKAFDEIRSIFALTPEAKVRGYGPGRFSFNVPGGRCEACQGDGLIKIEMNFLPDIYIECEECKGRRYNAETLDVKYKGKSIADVLAMSVEEALQLFEHIPSIRRKLNILNDVGLDYIKLGQSSTTLSGGESQRIKITRELGKQGTGKTLYLLDEPTTGLHFHDVKKLLSVLNRLVEKGNTVVVIEHNLDVIKNSDRIIDLGPEGGDAGGFIVAEGTPEQVAANANSHTGRYLKKCLNGRVK